MARVSKVIPNIFNGVSQQAPNLRLISQGEEQVNGYSTIVDGLKKRPPADHVAYLLNMDATDVERSFTHFIIRDGSERYILIIRGTTVSVFDLAGNQKTVTVVSNSNNYLALPSGFTGDPHTYLKAITVADTTFLLNRRWPTIAQGAAATKHNYAYVWVKRSAPFTKFSLTVNGTEFSYTTSAGTSAQADADIVAAGLQTELINGSHSVVRNGPFLRITSTVNTITAKDGFGGEGMVAFKHAVTKPSQLPPVHINGNYIEVTNDENADASYWLYFVSNDGAGGLAQGYWKEARNPYENYYYPGNAYMPITLTRQADGTFKLEYKTWKSRGAGDSTTNPLPSFINKPLSDIFFYKNRLGLVSGENIVLSELGEYYNFFRTTVLSLIDTDPIDVATPFSRVADIRYAVPWDERLYLFADTAQFVLHSQDQPLSPSTVEIDVVGEFDFKSSVRPVGAGVNLFFAAPKGNYTAIMEYFANENNATKDASDVTAHVPRYIAQYPSVMVASPAEDALFVASLDSVSQNSLWVYKWYWVGEEKVQSSWSKWTFPFKVSNACMVESTIYIVDASRFSAHHLYKIDLQSGETDGNLPCILHLDGKSMKTGVYYQIQNQTVWYNTSPVNGRIIVKGPGWGDTEGTTIPSVSITTETITADGDYSAYPCWIGAPYTMEYTFSPQYIKDQTEVTVTDGRLMLQRMSLNFARTAPFKVKVTPKSLNTSEYDNTHNVRVGDTEAVVGDIYLTTGSFTFPIMAQNTMVDIKIISDSYFPVQIQNAEWEGQYVNRTRRV
jgi:hypothetical protein